VRRARSRALFGVISIGAVLVSAAGLAYLGAVSYRADRGIVAARVAEHFRVAREAAELIDREVRAALAATAEAVAAADGSPTVDQLAPTIARHPLAARPFRIGARGELWVPGLGLLARPVDPVLDLQESLPQASGVRADMLERARQAELGDCDPECAAGDAGLSFARKTYGRLARFDDTGPAALLGLARIDRRGGEVAAARGRYLELADRFGPYRDNDGISYALWADLGAAEAAEDPRALLAVFEQLLDRRYAAPEAFLAVVAKELRDRLAAMPLESGARVRLDVLSERLSAVRATASVDADLVSIVRSASPEPRGRAGIRGRDRALVYQRLGKRDVVGIQLEPALFEPALSALDGAVAELVAGGELAVHAIAEEPSARKRVLATASIGPLAPNLAVSLVQSRAFADPLDEIVRDRSRRHLMFSLGLGALLVLGLVATIRGAARERELAKLKSDFVSTVSHELKTPLTSIRMFAEMLQQKVAGADRQREAHYHDIIVKESERLGLLIANLLDYSQVERGVRRYALATLDAGEVVAEAVATFRRLAEGEGRQVSVDPGSADCRVRADRESLIQSLLNLLGNAAKYSAGDAPIEVAVSREADRVTIAVSDQGPGIPASEQRRIFQEFYRTPSAQRSGVEGTGLGLALVKRHAEALGGTVGVDSEPGKGATFRLVLPAADEEPAGTSTREL
jgi:two-component system phosphate regulon sensor histidine kinase PhoR